jgi:hypothetical protein
MTPLSARQLIRGKLWGVMGASTWYLAAYAVPAVVLSVFGGLLALFWTVVWLAVTLLAMYFIGAAGIWCSVKAKNSWRALLSTMGLGYVGGTAVYLMTSPVIIILAVLILLLIRVLDNLLDTHMADVLISGLPWFLLWFFIASCVGLALIFWLMARFFLAWAQRWIADRERTRHWDEEPVYRRSRRRRSVPRVVEWERR